MFEQMRCQLMDWYTTRRTLEANTSGILVSPIAEWIQELIANRSRRYRFHSSNNVAFEVKSGVTTVDYLVNIELRICSCHAWQSTGFPCGHALAILMALRHDPQKYTMPFFTLEYYQKTYENAIANNASSDWLLFAAFAAT